MGEPTAFLDHVYLEMYSKTMWNKQRYCWQLQKPYLNHEFPREELKNFHARKIFVFLSGPTIWKVMPRSVWNDLLSCPTRRLNNSTKYLHHASMTTILKEEMKSVGELSKVCTKIVLKCLYLARIGRPDIQWSLNKLARSIIKWTKACDKWLCRLISYNYLVWYLTLIIHVNTNSIVVWVTLPNSADWDCSKTPILREILRIQNPRQEVSCAFLEVKHLFQ